MVCNTIDVQATCCVPLDSKLPLYTPFLSACTAHKFNTLSLSDIDLQDFHVIILGSVTSSLVKSRKLCLHSVVSYMQMLVS